MSLSNSEIGLTVDTFIIESMLSEPGLIKQAQAGGMISSLIDKVKSYVMAHINNDDKVGSVINIIAPGAIAMLFRSLGFRWLGFLIGLLLNVLHVDVAGIIRSFSSSVKSLITTGPVASSNIDSITSQLTQQHGGSEGAISANLDYSLSRDIRLVKQAVIDYQEKTLTKNAVGFMMKAKAVSIFVRILGWIFKAILASAGLMAAKDVIYTVFNKPNPLTGNYQEGKTSVQPIATHVATQSKFKINPSYSDNNLNTNKNNTWIEKITNNDASIENMLINFAKSVYSGLDGLDSVIKSSPKFQGVKQDIVDYNEATPGDVMVFIPRIFNNKKQIVDLFIDDVAQKAP